MISVAVAAQELGARLSEDLLGRHAEGAAHVPVGEQEPALAILEVDGRGGVVDDGLQRRLVGLQRLLCPPPLGVLLLDLGIEHGVLERDGRLRGEQLEHGEPPGGERPGDEPVLQVEQAEQPGLPHDREAQHRSRPLAREILVLQERVPGGGVVEQHALVAAADVVENGLRQRGRRRLARVEQPRRAPGRRDRRRGRQAIFPDQEHDPLSGARVLDHDAQEHLEQARELELAGDALRGLDHGQDVELLGPDGEGDGGGDRLARGEEGITLVELLDLGVGAPAEIGGAGLSQVGVCGRGQAARAVEPGGELAGDGLVLDEAALPRRATMACS